MRRKIILGDEYDDSLRDRLLQLLKSMGGERVDGNWAVGGSQLIETAKIALQGEIVEIEAETYIGISIAGEEARVKDIAARLNIDPERIKFAE